MFPGLWERLPDSVWSENDTSGRPVCAVVSCGYCLSDFVGSHGPFTMKGRVLERQLIHVAFS